METSKQMEIMKNENCDNQMETTKNNTQIIGYLPIEDALTLAKGLPLHVMDLIKYSTGKNHGTDSDIFAIIVLAIAIEKGFIPIGEDDHHDDEDAVNDPTVSGGGTNAAGSNNYDKLNWSYSFDSKFVEKYSQRIPNSFWQSKNTTTSGHNRYKLLLKLPETNVLCRLLITEFITDTFGMLVMCSIVNPNLTAHAQGTSVFFPILHFRHRPTDFIFNIADPLQSTLMDIIIKLKNEMFTPIRNGILSMHNQPYPGLFGIPAECMMNIRKYLNASQRF